MNEENKDTGGKAYRLMVPYTDIVDMAKKVLIMYNGYQSAVGNKGVIDSRHLNLLSYYFVYGYSLETKKKFAYCYSVNMQYVSVLDNEMKKRGLLVDKTGNFRTRGLCRELENMRRLFILEGAKDKNALVSLFYREDIVGADE